MKYIATINNQEHTVEIIDESHAAVNGKVHEINFEPVRGHLIFSLLVDGKSYEANIYQENGGWEVLMRGRHYSVQVDDERERQLKAAAGASRLPKGAFHLKSPMPGLVVQIPVKEGQEVEKGDVLLILESMKMQNELKSPRAGVISRILVTLSENVERKQTLLSVE
ncbi:MAG: acetyl-CoA carboxylase biotin carboxyl carrier protein subunit [Chloroflexota bacterium]|nr:acetyl-CoA carboxylase biotin carboxyl carrier protein subunit [Chloroflexota bacterium]